jgi:hypothetical protein
MMWHVQYTDEAGDKTRLHPTPETAIEFACGMIDRGLRVFGIGTEDLEDSISGEEIVRIYALWVRAKVPFGFAPDTRPI